MASHIRTKPPIEWSTVEKTLTTLEKLELLTHCQKALQKEGYVFTTPGEQEIWKKMRCQNCGQKIKRYRPPVSTNFLGYDDDLTEIDKDYTDYPGDGSEQGEYAVEVVRAAQSMLTVKYHCFFHDGQQFKGVWQCCGGRFNTQGCCSNIKHISGNIHDLREEWSFHQTPEPTTLLTSMASTPHPTSNSRISGKRDRLQTRYNNAHMMYPGGHPTTKSVRSAVALDCEMGTSRLGNIELIRLSLIDFFTRETLIDSLVIPGVEMAHYNTRYSGVTFAAMRKAERTNTGIRGVNAARKEVFKYVDSKTIVIAHGGSNDFTSLRWLHPADRIIDTCVLEAYDRTVRENGWKKSLKEVCMRRCGISVQDAKLDNGRAAGHDSVEDAFAAREIVCWWLKMIPDN